MNSNSNSNSNSNNSAVKQLKSFGSFATFKVGTNHFVFQYDMDGQAERPNERDEMNSTLAKDTKDAKGKKKKKKRERHTTFLLFTKARYPYELHSHLIIKFNFVLVIDFHRSKKRREF
ncbi:uncharacterized protein LOC124952203 isoform X2 [Vespa velutina]|uniref:uncharacterized protein LOC124952203 isoform X2 n=1 Tax=Vespa velutina TaxID=202808 RepID=UPI001FB37860|nr:uncharacterized protein LOC124952203 isoform X2 [Vespa velutina]